MHYEFELEMINCRVESGQTLQLESIPAHLFTTSPDSDWLSRSSINKYIYIFFFNKYMKHNKEKEGERRKETSQSGIFICSNN